MTAGTSCCRLAEAGRALVERLGGRWSNGAGLCRCPAHDDRRPSLSVRVGRSRLLLHCFAGCTAAEILRALRAAGIRAEGGGDAGAGGHRESRTPPAAALRLWGAARPAAGTPAEAYLRSRGLAAGDPQLRFHGRTPDGPRPFTRFRPALIAAVRDPGGLVAVHRTFLGRPPDGEAPTVLHRSALGRLGSGAVRLGGAGAKLGLAEGVETALSASILFGIPCWATLGTERFARVTLPLWVEELVLFLDNDPGGRRAEALARSAFPNLRIEARYPRAAGADWNDVLLG
jgi:hypothetical protein